MERCDDLLGLRDQEDFAGVGATHFFAGGDTDDVDLLAFVEGTVNETFFAGHGQSEGDLSGLWISRLWLRWRRLSWRSGRWRGLCDGWTFRLRRGTRCRRAGGIDIFWGLVSESGADVAWNGQRRGKGVFQIAGLLPSPPWTGVQRNASAGIGRQVRGLRRALAEAEGQSQWDEEGGAESCVHWESAVGDETMRQEGRQLFTRIGMMT